MDSPIYTPRLIYCQRSGAVTQDGKLVGHITKDPILALWRATPVDGAVRLFAKECDGLPYLHAAASASVSSVSELRLGSVSHSDSDPA